MKHTPEHGYVSFEPENELVFVRFENGKIDLSVYLSNETNEEQAMLASVTAWADDSSPVIIAPHFTVASPVDYLIDMHEMPAHNNHIDANAKPIFDALRAEMVAQIARIDALVFEDPDSQPPIGGV